MVPRYGSAIVIGCSMAGLLTARSLANHFRHVTVVDRDALADGATLRKGVPQAAHAHGLLASGYRVIERYMPGIMEELEAAGAPRGDVVGDFLWFQYGFWKLRHPSGLTGITVSRPSLEAAVRRRVRALPNVAFLDSTEAIAPVFDRESARVVGVSLRDRERGDEEARTLPADLVVDASGRGSRSPRWLQEWGFGQPPESCVKVDVGYATRIFERRAGDLWNSMGAVISGTPPQTSRYAAVLATEGPRWMVTLVGSVGDYPPTDEREWLSFAASLPVPAVHELATAARPLTDIVQYRFPANQRRMYERMKRFPEGYVVLGDALCSFNPIYGQGMSVAAMEAEALDECLATGMEKLSSRFYGMARKIVEIPWTIATGEDLRFPQIEGPRPPGFALVNRYLERVHAVASYDREACRRFFDVLNLLAPPQSLMAPRMALRMARAKVPPPGATPEWLGAKEAHADQRNG